jgi:uncharacterized protein YbjT (DUF2867 family)
MKPYLIIGATGHIGQAVMHTLLAQNLPVIALTSDSAHIKQIEAAGAKAVVVNVRNTEKLKATFKLGSRLFLLSPPALPSTDTVKEERLNIASILQATYGAELEYIVAASTYGAQPGKQIGDLGVLYEMEQKLQEQPIPYTILRGAYYYSNWDVLLAAAKKGALPTVYPAGFKLPMVAPEDIGHYAATLLTGSIEPGIIHSIEGPERYSPKDVAAAFQQALGTAVKAVSISKEKWEEFFKTAGYLDISAEYMVNMTELTIDHKYGIPGPVEKGRTTIEEYIAELARNSHSC